MEKNFGESAINIQEERIYAWGRKLRIKEGTNQEQFAIRAQGT
jgi:hypothetical protein